jgi:hypothetical protein
MLKLLCCHCLQVADTTSITVVARSTSWAIESFPRRRKTPTSCKRNPGHRCLICQRYQPSHSSTNPDISVSKVTRLRVGRPGFDSRRGRIFIFCAVSRPALGLTQSPVQWVPGFFSRNESLHGAQLYLVPRLRMRGAIRPLYVSLLAVVLRWRPGSALLSNLSTNF